MNRAGVQCLALFVAGAVLAAASGLAAAEAPRRDPEVVFKRLDANGDGRLSPAEFDALPASRRVPGLFGRLDRNGDGVVVPAEFNALLGLRGEAGEPRPQAAAAALAPPVVAKGTAVEIARYRAASEYSARFAGLHLLVMKDGEVVFEQHAQGASPRQAYQIASGTKSFWGPLAQVAVGEGLFTLDEVVAGTLSEWKADSRKARITVRDLLTFSSGLEAPRRLWAEKDKDLYKLVLELPAVADPGTIFAYSEVHLYAFGEFLKRKLAQRARANGTAPERPWDYLNRTILTPIGLTGLRWSVDGSGAPRMGAGAVLTARQWATYGELLRQGGAWQGQQLIPREGVAACFASSRANAAYGLTFWLNRASDKAGVAQADIAGGGRTRSSDQVSARGIVPGRLPDLVMAAGAGQQRLFISNAEKLVVVRFANADMPRLVMAGDYSKLNLNFKDEEFFARLLAPN
jgi:CubicO group peptidase (beta-lactamase class C family)